MVHSSAVSSVVEDSMDDGVGILSPTEKAFPSRFRWKRMDKVQYVPRIYNGSRRRLWPCNKDVSKPFERVSQVTIHFSMNNVSYGVSCIDELVVNSKWFIIGGADCISGNLEYQDRSVIYLEGPKRKFCLGGQDNGLSLSNLKLPLAKTDLSFSRFLQTMRRNPESQGEDRYQNSSQAVNRVMVGVNEPAAARGAQPDPDEHAFQSAMVFVKGAVMVAALFGVNALLKRWRGTDDPRAE